MKLVSNHKYNITSLCTESTDSVYCDSTTTIGLLGPGCVTVGLRAFTCNSNIVSIISSTIPSRQVNVKQKM